MQVLFVITVLCLSAAAQPWTMSRFDYVDYQPVPISPTHFSIPVQRRPVRMLASPRYRPDAAMGQHPFPEDPFHQGTAASLPPHQRPPLASPPPMAAASAFGGSYFPEEPPPSNVVAAARAPQSNGVTDFMSRLATTIPEIAEKMAKMTPTTKPKFNAGFYTFSPQIEADNGNNNGGGGSRGGGGGGNTAERDFLGNVQKSGLGMFFVTDPKETTTPEDGVNRQSRNNEKNIANIVDSMPQPNSLFSFNKLFSAFTPPPPAATPPPRGAAEQKDGTIYDMRQIKGTPILKDEDEATEFIQKPDEFVSNSVPSTEAPNPAENLLGTLLSGKIDQVDWIGAIFNKNSIPGAGEQNPITQLFKGGFFGSGLDDDAKITKPQDQNFQ